MLRTVLLAGALLASGITAAKDLAEIPADPANEAMVSLPWPDFKPLFEDRLRRQWQAQQAAQLSPLIAIDSADYQLRIASDGARGSLSLSGQVLRGQPEPILLFQPDLTITEIEEMEGGVLFSDKRGYSLHLPRQGSFRLVCEIALPLREDERSRFLSFAIPAAVRNGLKLELASELRLLEAPGLALDALRYAFSPRAELKVRIAATGDTTLAPVVDSFSRFELTDAGYRVTAFFAPTRELRQPLQIRFANARWLASSLQPAWVKSIDADTVRVELPDGWRQPFSLEYQLDSEIDAIELPRIADNLGREGAFQIIEPEHARINVQGEGLQQGIAVQRLAAELREYASVDASHARLSGSQPLHFVIERLMPLAVPPVVLDAVYLYHSFVDNGSILSVLRLELDLPPMRDKRLVLAAVPDAEIWSLTVNGVAKKVYGQTQEQWIVPLADGASIVELAYWRPGNKLGLQGRLEMQAPALGLAARSFNLVVGLNERLELVALEGDFEPGDGANWPRPADFSGKAYYFTRPFYRGERVNGAIHYREPVHETGGKAS